MVFLGKSTCPIAVAHPVEVVFQLVQFGGQVRQAVEAREEVQWVRLAASAAAAEFTKEGRRKHDQLFLDCSMYAFLLLQQHGQLSANTIL